MNTEIEWSTVDKMLEAGMEACTVNQWYESGENHADVPLAVAWDEYRKAEAAGTFRLLSAWRGAEMVGYAAFFLVNHPMYSTTPHAMCDSIYCKPEYRGVGLLLVRAAERKLRELIGPKLFRLIYCAPIGGSLPELLEHLGYPQTESVHVKLVRPVP